jgi:hypothetical protein
MYQVTTDVDGPLIPLLNAAVDTTTTTATVDSDTAPNSNVDANIVPAPVYTVVDVPRRKKRPPHPAVRTK